MTCLSKSEQCRGELFRPNERYFSTFSDICKIAIKIKQGLLFHAPKV